MDSVKDIEQPAAGPVQAIVRRCDGCEFWEPYDEPGQRHSGIKEAGDNTGLCRRFPPAIDAAFRMACQIGVEESSQITDDLLQRSANYEWRWPATISSDWCGEFKATKSV